MSTLVEELLDDITHSLEYKKCAIGVFIDLKKAFDTVDHQLLYKKNLNFMAFVEMCIIGPVVT